ncbi:hypothetical protein MBLNU457_5720t1 [Dothideomycetes sp. NU457]
MIDASSPDVPLGSSPTIFPERTSSRQHLAPSPANTMQRKPSNASSAFTFDLDKIPNYQYDGEDSDIGTLDGDSDGTATPTRERSPSYARDAQGRARQRAERSSQELSKRAEMILANAKKRLNLMDQNLRGARALTAENLQRSTSMQANHAPYMHRYLGSNGSSNSTAEQESSAIRMPLGHARGRSDAVIYDVPKRPSTAMARETLPSSDVRERPVADSAAWTANTLRGTRSQELPRTSSRSMRITSPEPQLEPLIESEPAPAPIRLGKRSSSSPIVTTELQEQMQQLKGRISFLREKARADSMRRQSSQVYRAPNPFTDAERQNGTTSKRSSGSTGRDSENSTPPLRPLVSRWSADSSVKRMSYLPRGQWSPDLESPGIMEEDAAFTLPTEPSVKSISPDIDWRPVGHIRTVSSAESVPVEPDIDVASIKGSIVEVSPDLSRNASLSTLESEYHDAPTTVAHEDREDAFDYHNFFLHSTMGRFNQQNSDTASEDSDDTERGARMDPESFPMLGGGFGTPKTPEMLRNIERKLHERQKSSNSVTTLGTDSASINSFATATEGRMSPIKKSEGSDGADSGVAFHKDRGFHKRQVSSQVVAQIRTINADPTSVAVHAVTDIAQQSPMGMKDKTLVFMLVESIKDACLKLQDENTPSSEGRVLRRRLEEARKVLEGHSPVVSEFV